MSERGIVLWEGKSMLTGAPIAAIVTGLAGDTLNPKTGPMLQVWVIRTDMPPMEAKRSNLDDAICGDCELRGRNGHSSGCYVTVWFGPHNVYKHYQAGGYPRRSMREVRETVRDWNIRVTAYGDPAATPYDVWQNLLTTAGGWVGYTHQWRHADQRLRWLLMASVSTEKAAREAQAKGWRTFRARLEKNAIVSGKEFTCPASDEAGHRVTCEECQLCRGRASRARNVVIIAHGRNENIRAFRILTLSGEADGRRIYPLVRRA